MKVRQLVDWKKIEIKTIEIININKLNEKLDLIDSKFITNLKR
jgi:hypothetical protein